ncbi:SLT domain-containing protein [Forsythia ovata]|uniref:SLT domain-containing protein n=1 Tax=Forsythia ovata TaxID=205694 RepID=A0ABD1RPR2_9LAMI
MRLMVIISCDPDGQPYLMQTEMKVVAGIIVRRHFVSQIDSDMLCAIAELESGGVLFYVGIPRAIVVYFFDTIKTFAHIEKQEEFCYTGYDRKLYGKLLDLCNVDSSLHELEMRFLLPRDALFAEPIQITLDKYVHWYVSLTKQGQHRPICVTRVIKGPAEFSHVVNNQSDAVEVGELEFHIEIETLSFNNVQ